MTPTLSPLLSRWSVSVIVLLGTSLSCHAQIVEVSGNVTPVPVPHADFPSGWYVQGEYLLIGDTSDGTMLIGGGALLSTLEWESNQTSAIGSRLGSTGTVTVEGGWNTGRLYLGGLRQGDDIYTGGTGILTIANGGSAYSWDAYIGYGEGSVGTVAVTGAQGSYNIRSEWHTGDLFVGGGGNHHGLNSGGGSGTLTVTDGGCVSSGGAVIGSGAGAVGTVVVSGTAYNSDIEEYFVSELNTRSIIVGDAGGTGNLSVTDGGRVSSVWDAVVGSGEGAVGTATVSGAGSEWLGSHIRIGSYDSSGQLMVSDGGAIVGHDGNSVDVTVEGMEERRSQIVVTGNGSLLDGGNLNIFGYSDVIVSDNGTLRSRHLDIGENSTLTLDGGIFSAAGIDNLDRLDFVRGTLINSGSMNGAVNVQDEGNIVITGKDATWEVPNGIRFEGTGENGLSLRVEEGGKVAASIIETINYGSSIHVTVTGSGSLLEVTQFRMPESGIVQYSILDGGTVKGENVYFPSSDLGKVVSLDGGTLDIDGGGAVSQWLDFRKGTLINRGQLYDHIDMPNGGHVVISGPGANWEAGSTPLFIGSDRKQGMLTIEDGGRVSNSGAAYIGYGEGSTGTVMVTGTLGDYYYTRPEWNVGNQLFVGGGRDIDDSFPDVSGGTGTLTIANTGLVSSESAYIGYGKDATGTVTVTGGSGEYYTRSEWNVSNQLFVGGSSDNYGFLPSFVGGTGTLTIMDGGRVSSGEARVGYGKDATGTVTVAGTSADGYYRSEWDVRGDLVVGGREVHVSYPDFSGGTGTLTITDGGWVSSRSARIGSGMDTTGTVVVAGTSADRYYRSEWEIYGELNIGGSDNRPGGTGTLTIADGGKVSVSGSTGIGLGEDAVGTVGVSGNFYDNSNQEYVASELSTGDITIGHFGGTGTLMVTDGGKVSSQEARIGSGLDAVGTVVVSGSAYNNSTGERLASELSAGDITIGHSGGTGTLTITDGGNVSSGSARIGDGTGAVGAVAVSGADSQWLANHIQIGSNHGSGQLLVSEGGVITGRDGNSVDVTVEGSNNHRSKLVVTGNGSLLDGGYLNVLDHSDVVVSDKGTLRSRQLYIAEDSTLTLNGGTLRMENESLTSATKDGLKYLSGTIQLSGSRNVGSDSVIADIFGAELNLTAGKQLNIEETARLEQQVTLDGGTFGFNNIDNRELLDYQSGTIFLFGERSIGFDSDINHFFGENLTVSTGKGLAIEQMARLDRELVLDGGTLSAGGIDYLNNLVFVSGTLINSGRMNGTVNVQDGGKIVITGKDAIWEAPGLFSFGGMGDDGFSLLVENGGKVITDSIEGGIHATVTGSGSLLEVVNALWLNGLQSDTRISILDSGTVKTGRIIHMQTGNPGKMISLDGGTLDFDGGSFASQWLDFRKGTLINRGQLSGAIDIPDAGHVVISGQAARWQVNGARLFIGVDGKQSTLTIEDGGGVSVWGDRVAIGSGAGSVGAVVASGNASDNPSGEYIPSGFGADYLAIGDAGGTGTLTIADGARASVGATRVGSGIGSVGAVAVSGSGYDNRNDEYVASELSAVSGFTVGDAGGSGTLTITDGGKVSSQETVRIGNGEDSVGAVVVSGSASDNHDGRYIASELSTNNYLTIGVSGGSGTLTITDGGKVSSQGALLGHGYGGSGTVVVSGNASDNPSGEYVASRLVVAGELTLGVAGGSGALTITDGGKVSSQGALIGHNLGGSGTVMVAGVSENSDGGYSHSEWQVDGNLQIGGGALIPATANSTLDIKDGGIVKVRDSLKVGQFGIVNIQVGESGGLQVGQSLTNNGLIRLSAAANLGAGEYTPLLAQDGYDGSGEYRAFGGVWHQDSQRFVVAAAQSAHDGAEATIDLQETQRLSVIGRKSQIMVSFDADAESVDGGSKIHFTATENNAPSIYGERVLSAWNFTTDMDYGHGTLLAFSIGYGWDVDMLRIWRSVDGISWAVMDIERLYSGDTISFFVEGFSSYAVSAVPEPGTCAAIVALLVVGVALRMKRRNRIK